MAFEGAATPITVNETSSTVASNCYFWGANYGVINNSGSTNVDARWCWWEDPNGPGKEGDGNGCRVTTNVEYDPWIGKDHMMRKGASSKDPVYTCTGNFTLDETDFAIPSVGLPLTFGRSYNSIDTYSGPLGRGWTHAYNTRLNRDVVSVQIKWFNGQVDRYRPLGNGTYAHMDRDVRDQLWVETNGTWRLRRRNLSAYTFNTNGTLAAITDRNGNALSCTYDDQQRLQSVTDPTGRQLSFTWTTNLLTYVTDPVGRSVSFAYTNDLLREVTDVLGGTMRYAYDANGFLATIEDQRGVVTVSNEYDTLGRVLLQRDGNGNPTAFAYDTAAGETVMTDAMGYTTTHRHESGLLSEIEYENGSRVSYTYDDAWNRTGITDRNGNTVTFAYDEIGNVTNTIAPDGGIDAAQYGDARFPELVTRKSDPVGVVTEWEYDPHGNVVIERRAVDTHLECERRWTYNAHGQAVTFTNELGHATRYGYEDAAGPHRGLLRWVEDAQGYRTWYQHDILWRRIGVTDARGSVGGDPAYTTRYDYDQANRVTNVVTPVASVQYRFDSVGRRIAAVDANGHETIHEYDANGNLRFMREPLGRVTEYVYDALNRKVQVIDPNDHVTTNAYDAVGNLVTTTRLMDGDGPDLVTRYTHDAHGNVLSVTDPTGLSFHYAYDVMHRKVSQSNELGHTRQWLYDTVGRVTNTVDANGVRTSYAFGILGKLETVMQAGDDDSQRVTGYDYDLVGNILRMRDAGERVTEKQYDSLSRVIMQRDGNGNEYHFVYDPVGNQTNVLNANGHSISMTYDAVNRLTRRDDPDGTAVVFTHDAAGNLLRMADSSGTTAFGYDELNRLVASTNSFGDVVRYAYDLVGERTSLFYPGDLQVTYSHDAANRLRTVTTWSNQVTSYEYDGAGRMTRTVYPNGIEQTQHYDGAGRLSAMGYALAGSNLLSYAYTRDPVGKPVGRGSRKFPHSAAGKGTT